VPETRLARRKPHQLVLSQGVRAAGTTPSGYFVHGKCVTQSRPSTIWNRKALVSKLCDTHLQERGITIQSRRCPDCLRW